MFGTRNHHDLFNNLIGLISHAEKERNRREYNITNENGLEGVSTVNIPHKCLRVEYVGGYYYCKSNNMHVYTKEGVLLFEASDVRKLGSDMFLVQELKSEDNNNELGYALYEKGVALTEFVYKPHGMSSTFNKSGFIILNVFDNYNEEVVIDKTGKEMFAKTDYDSIYLHGVLLSTKKGYLNLLTHKYICEKGYSSTMETKQDKFVKVGDLVYQINMFTGEFVIHGEGEQKEAPLTNEEEEKREQERIARMEKKSKAEDEINEEGREWKALGRNSKCLCGSKKKFKSCCIKVWEYKLRKRFNAIE
jgi:hypothetical protein